MPIPHSDPYGISQSRADWLHQLAVYVDHPEVSPEVGCTQEKKVRMDLYGWGIGATDVDEQPGLHEYIQGEMNLYDLDAFIMYT